MGTVRMRAGWGLRASGRALELMNQGLVWLADNLRVSYGEGGLLPLCRMILRAAVRYPVVVDGRAVGDLDVGAGLGLVWPPWYPSSSEDRARDAATLMGLSDGGHLPAATVERWLDDEWGISGSGDRGAGFGR